MPKHFTTEIQQSILTFHNLFLMWSKLFSETLHLAVRQCNLHTILYFKINLYFQKQSTSNHPRDFKSKITQLKIPVPYKGKQSQSTYPDRCVMFKLSQKCSFSVILGAFERINYLVQHTDIILKHVARTGSHLLPVYLVSSFEEKIWSNWINCFF
jgi:hypothetical protein